MGQFIGHLHPLLVHLPIGFILLAIIIEWLQKEKVGPGLSNLMWFFSALASLGAIVTGLTLSGSGHYEDLSVFLHRWLAILVGIFSALIWYLQWRQKEVFRNQNTILKILTVVALIATGHFGGEITHGKGFLLSQQGEESAYKDLSAYDSVFVFKDLIEPIFDAKCNKCHEPGDARGRLDLTTIEGLTDDTFGDPAIKAGDLYNSEVFKRVILPQSNPKFMPPSGMVLNYEEIKILEWWILSGASFDDPIDSNIPESIATILKKRHQLDFGEQSIYSKIKVDSIGQESVEKVWDANFNFTPISSELHLYDVSKSGKPIEITPSEMQILTSVAPNVVWIDFSRTEFDDKSAETLGQFTNLTKLNLSNTKISNEALKYISNLQRLEVLNLYGTDIDAIGLKTITDLTSLTHIYIWQTKVSPSDMEELQSTFSGVEIIGGQ